MIFGGIWGECLVAVLTAMWKSFQAQKPEDKDSPDEQVP